MGVQPDQSLPPPEGRVTRSKRKQAPESQPSASSTSAASSSQPKHDRMGEDLPKPKRPKNEKRAEEGEEAGAAETEKRLRKFRPKAPQAFYEIYERATSQRFFVLGRTRCGTQDCPEEMVELTGSTGNIYNVHIAQNPTCDCPHARKGHQCKHWLYVMSRVLRARFDLVYQLALLSSELREIMANAPPPLDETAAEQGSDHHKNRKPIEGDCPICFEELSAAAGADDGAEESGGGSKHNTEQLVWCRAACGQNMHKQCFQMWSATKRQQAGGASKVTCPFCRSPWEGDDDMVRNINKQGPLNEDGYVNVASQLGISTVRDYSSYSSWWGRSGRSHGRRYRY